MKICLFCLVFITCFMLFGSVLTAFAGSNGTSISALLNSNLKVIMLNGSDSKQKIQMEMYFYQLLIIVEHTYQ